MRDMNKLEEKHGDWVVVMLFTLLVSPIIVLLAMLVSNLPW